MKTAFIGDFKDLREIVSYNLKKRGFEIVKNWSGIDHFIFTKTPRTINWKTIYKDCKLINHHPVSRIITDKRELSHLSQDKSILFMPFSFEGYNALNIKEKYNDYIKNPRSKDLGEDIWIVKPSSAWGGKDIKLITTTELLNPYHEEIFYNRIIQKYIENPLLLEGCKFDFRMYVLFTQENELYLYPSFMTRYSLRKYTTDNILDLSYHLTNTSIQSKIVSKERYHEIVSSEERFWKKYEREYGKRFDLIEQVGKIMIEMFDLIQDSIKLYKKDRYYQLFGVDMMMDSSKNLYLIEFNENPSINTHNNKNLIEQREKLINNIFKLTVDRIFNNMQENTDFIFLKKY